MRDSAPNAARDQEAEAQRLFDTGRQREAAAIYARLADKEVDKRARSILRAKEREARKIETERQLADLTARARGMRDRGNVAGAIALLEQGQKLVGDAPGVGTVAPGSDSGPISLIAAEIAELRASVAGHKRNRVMLITAIVMLLGAATVAALLWLLRPAETAPAKLTHPAEPASAPVLAQPAIVDSATAEAPATNKAPTP